MSVMFEPTSWGIAQEEGSGTGSPTLKERRLIAPYLRQVPGLYPKGVEVYALWFNSESTTVDSLLTILGGGAWSTMTSTGRRRSHRPVRVIVDRPNRGGAKISPR